MGENGLSASDVAMLANNGDGFANNGIWWLALMIMFGGGFGGWGNRGGNVATQEFVQNGFNFNDLQDQNRDIITAINNGTAQAVGAANQAKYDNLSAIRDAQTALGSQISDVRTMEQNILANQNDCCGSTKMLLQFFPS